MPYLGEYETTLDFFQECVGLLSPERVGRQRVINLVLMNELLIYPEHPHTLGAQMWKGYEWVLLQYQEVVCDYWDHELAGPRDIGGDDWYYNITQKQYNAYLPKGEQFHEPPWLGDEELALSHQSYLLREDPAYYRKYFPHRSDSLPLVWPHL